MIFGTSVITGIFIILLIALPIMGLGTGFVMGMISNEYVLYLIGAIVIFKLLFGNK